MCSLLRKFVRGGKTWYVCDRGMILFLFEISVNIPFSYFLILKSEDGHGCNKTRTAQICTWLTLCQIKRSCSGPLLLAIHVRLTGKLVVG